jgi:hypothetical protein
MKFFIEQIRPIDFPSGRYPFSDVAYLNLFEKHFGEKEDKIVPVVLREKEHKADVLASCCFVVKGSALLLQGMQKVIGGQEVTDYGEVVFFGISSKDEKIAMWNAIQGFIKGTYPQVKQIILDNVRSDMLECFTNRSKDVGLVGIVIEPIEVSPFIQLPKTWEEYLLMINGKDRQELKRKMRRLEKTKFDFSVSTSNDLSRVEFDEFVNLHKASDFNKDKFMSKKMEEFFWDLICIKFEKWTTKLARLDIDGQSAASLLLFSNENELLFYNSGFDPKLNYYSPGLMLNALLIKDAILSGVKTFDFLRGDERYKYDLGASDMQLCRVVINMS